MSQTAAQANSLTLAGEPPVARLDRRVSETILTSLALLMLILSLIGESLAWPRYLILVLNVVGYASGGWYGLRDTIASLRLRRLDINLLMILAAIGAALINQWHEGLTLLFLFSLSNTLQTYAMERSANAINSLIKLRPTEATVIKDGRELRVGIDALQPGDVMRIRPGEMVATDGVILSGHSDLNQASITGESSPVEKGEGDPVFAGTLNGSGALDVTVRKLASESTLARIIQLVESAQLRKAGTQRVLDRFEAPYAIGVIAAAALTALVPTLFMGSDAAASFYRAMVLLVVASPCALIISTPASILSAIANGARRGILFKGGVHLEHLAEVKVVAFDKTGTLTEGRMQVTDIELSNPQPVGLTEEQLLALAAALESRSEHPIAKSIHEAAKARGITCPPLEDFINLPGRGIHARSDGFLVWIGGERMYQEHGEVMPAALAQRKQELESQGKTVLIVHRELSRDGDTGNHERHGGWLGLIAVADRIRPNAQRAVAALKAQGIRHVVMLTGDNGSVAAAVAAETGVDEFVANLLPEEKVAAIERLQLDHGPVLMVGDGVNDAPALAAANVGAAMGAAGSDVALQTADLVLMSDAIDKIPFAIALSRRARRVVWQNLTFASAVIVVLIISAMGFSLPLPLGVVGHEGSTLVVVANGLRLLGFRMERAEPAASSAVAQA